MCAASDVKIDVRLKLTLDSEDRDVKSLLAVRFCAGGQNTLGILVVTE